MLCGARPPDWAKSLLFKWVEHDDPYYNRKIRCYIWFADYFPNADSNSQVRIFFDSEASVRVSLAGEEQRGLSVSFICEDKYIVIDTPNGLEEWTKEETEAHQEIWKEYGEEIWE